MAPSRVVVVDPERAVAEALATALGALVPEVEVTSDGPQADVVVATWPAGAAGACAALVIAIPAQAGPADVRAADAAGALALVMRSEPLAVLADAVRLAARGTRFVSPAVEALLGAGAASAGAPSFTPAEARVLHELATRPDTRSRLALRLGVTTSTLDNQLAAIKRKVLASAVTSQNAPSDGYLSTEALIGWATRQQLLQKT